MSLCIVDGIAAWTKWCEVFPGLLKLKYDVFSGFPRGRGDTAPVTTYRGYFNCVLFAVIWWSLVSKYSPVHLICNMSPLKLKKPLSCKVTDMGLHKIPHVCIYCKKGIVIATDSLLFQIQMSEHNSLLYMWRRTTWQSFPHSQPTFLHIIIPS